MEHLPRRGPTQSYSDAWRNFWSVAWRNAENEVRRMIAGHGPAQPQPPLTQVVLDFESNPGNESAAKRAGQSLYGTLSNNIHHFQGGYEVIDDQWDNTVAAVLRALAQVHFCPGGDVNWDAEGGDINARRVQT